MKDQNGIIRKSSKLVVWSCKTVNDHYLTVNKT